MIKASARKRAILTRECAETLIKPDFRGAAGCSSTKQAMIAKSGGGATDLSR
jgi:hypothetical protein